jgi:hypothetical protein
MEYLGQPFQIQNTADRGWLVTWSDAIGVRTEDGEPVESVSFTVALPRRADLTIAEVQTYALKRAVELLQVLIRDRESRSRADPAA